MGFIAPFIGPALGVLGGLLGGRGGQSKQQKSATDLMSGLVSDLRGKSEEYSPYAAGFLNTAKDAFPQALNFWAPLLSGSRTAATGVLAPDISRINDQFNQILQQTKGERTGAGASIYAAAPYEKQSQIQSLFSTLRPQAAQNVANIGSAAGGLGTSTLQAIISAMGQALGGSHGMLNQANDAYKQSQEGGKSFFNSLTGLLGEIMKQPWKTGD
jgi:hypothetical protein